MPGLGRRREDDLRSDRLESQVRMSEASASLSKPFGPGKRLFMCSSCRRPFEEKSRHCPRCDSKTMGEIKAIPPQHVEEARRKSLERLKARG